jgi:AcrR family transcriptional regulator
MRVTSETKAATRKRIVEAAQEQFAKRGFEATTTRDIAAAAGIAVGTLFNYFPTKEAIVSSLVNEACATVVARFAEVSATAEERSLEEELFAHVAAVLRKLGPYRKYVPAVLDTALSPLANADGEPAMLRAAHLETVVGIATRHGRGEALTPVALQMYWTLFTGVLAYWASDRSPRQVDTLALLDQSLAMFVGWLTGQGDTNAKRARGG